MDRLCGDWQNPSGEMAALSSSRWLSILNCQKHTISLDIREIDGRLEGYIGIILVAESRWQVYKYLLLKFNFVVCLKIFI